MSTGSAAPDGSVTPTSLRMDPAGGGVPQDRPRLRAPGATAPRLRYARRSRPDTAGRGPRHRRPDRRGSAPRWASRSNFASSWPVLTYQYPALTCGCNYHSTLVQHGWSVGSFATPADTKAIGVMRSDVG